jgi:ketosteroid isomerase-like protein
VLPPRQVAVLILRDVLGFHASEVAEDAIVAKFARAWESADLDTLVALLTDDVFIAMPPAPFGYEGRDAVTRFCASQFAATRRFDLVPARANGQPAFGAYLHAPSGIRHGTGLYVLTLVGDWICAMTHFEASVLPWFGQPRSLPSR